MKKRMVMGRPWNFCRQIRFAPFIAKNKHHCLFSLLVGKIANQPLMDVVSSPQRCRPVSCRSRNTSKCRYGHCNDGNRLHHPSPFRYFALHSMSKTCVSFMQSEKLPFKRYGGSISEPYFNLNSHWSTLSMVVCTALVRLKAAASSSAIIS